MKKVCPDLTEVMIVNDQVIGKAMAYRAEAKDSDGGVRVKAGCRLIDEYVEHSTPFNNYNAL